MQKIAAVDFDRTIPDLDSLKYALIKEKFYLKAVLSALCVFLSRITAFKRKKREHPVVRNLFTKQLLLSMSLFDMRFL